MLLQDDAAVTEWPAWATEHVEVQPPDDAWQRSGEQERRRLDTALGAWLVAAVEHVGSTAVPGLPAKPILRSGLCVPHRRRLAPTGWHYVPPELDARPWRRFLVKVDEGDRVAHLHLMSLSHPRWRQQLVFRDALRADPVLARSYALLKETLAARHAEDREAHTSGKADFIEDFLRGRNEDKAQRLRMP